MSGLIPAETQANVPAVAGSYAGDQFAPPEPAKNPLERPLAALRRYKWLIVVVVALSGAVGVVGARFIQPRYDVHATLWVATESRNNDRIGPIRSAELLNSAAWIELFKSYRIVDAVVRSLSLYLQPKSGADMPLFTGFTLAERFAPGKYLLTINRSEKRWTLAADGIVVERGTPADSVGRKVGFQWQLPAGEFDGKNDRKVEFLVVTPREQSMKMIANLKPRLADGSNFLWLNYQASSPGLAAQTLNTWVHEYVAVAAELKKKNLVEFANILQGQLQYAEKATQEAEAAYQSFKVNTIVLPTQGTPVAPGAGAQGVAGDPAILSFFEQKIAFDNLRHDREAMEKSISAASAGAAPFEGLLLIPSVATSAGAEPLRDAFRKQNELQAQLTAARQTFTDEYPAVKELASSLNLLQKQTIPQLAVRLLAQIKDRESDYQRRITSAARELQDIPPRTIEEHRLSRAVSVSEGLYTNLKARYAEAQLAEASTAPDVTVLDTAVVPRSPTMNTAPRLLLMAVGGGFGLAIGLALLLDMLDRRLRYSEQVTTELGLGIAGAVPRVPKGGINSSSPEQVSQFVESFRTLRMHVMHSLAGPRYALAISSAAPGDGKSLVSANLALSFAESGLRTVLVDGDTRRGVLHKMFDLPLAGGLTDFLTESITATQAVRKTAHDNLSFVSAGHRHPRSPELLASVRLKQFVQHLSSTFDVVIFDTPPLAAGIDGFAISAATGSLLMVLRMGQTERRLVAAKLAVLDRLPVDVLGAVLNGVALTGEFQYYAYSPGYAVESEEPAGELAASSS